MMTTWGRSAALAAMLLLVAGCGGSGNGGEAKKEAPAKPMISVAGVVHVDDLGSITYKKQADECVATGDLAGSLAIGKSSVLITDPNGKKVALGKIAGSKYSTVQMDNETYVSPGVCDFTFTSSPVERVDGVYTASIPDLNIEAQFPATAANNVRLRYTP